MTSEFPRNMHYIFWGYNPAVCGMVVPILGSPGAHFTNIDSYESIYTILHFKTDFAS